MNLKSFFSSLRLTLALLLVLAFLSAMGTVLPPGSGGDPSSRATSTASWARALAFGDLYHSPVFRLLLGLLCLNLVICFSRRLKLLSPRRQREAALASPAVLTLSGGEGVMEDLSSRLVRDGYQVVRMAGPGRAFTRGRLRMPLVFLSHASLLLILGSSLAGSFLGFVGTQRVLVGQGTGSWYDWKTLQDRPLPFRLDLLGIRFEKHPLALRLQTFRNSGGERGPVVTTHVGGRFLLPGIPGYFTMEEFDPEKKTSFITWRSPNGIYRDVRPWEEVGDTGLSIDLLAWKEFPGEKQVFLDVAVSRGGTPLAEGVLAVGKPFSFEGVEVFLVDYGTDPFGFPYAGFQFSRDPGKTGFWAGCVLFLFSVTGALFLRQRTVVLVEKEGALAVHLAAFPGKAAARESLASLADGPGEEADA